MRSNKTTRTFCIFALILLFTLAPTPFSFASGQQTDSPDLIETFPVGGYPDGLAYDGENIYVANSGDSTVTKLRASDGAQLGLFNTGVGPVELCQNEKGRRFLAALFVFHVT